MRVYWAVDDGYVGKNRPHHTDIEDEDLEGLTDDERRDTIAEIVQEDFDQSISWYIDRIEED